MERWDGFVKPEVFVECRGVIYISKNAVISPKRGGGRTIRILVDLAIVRVDQTTWGQLKPLSVEETMLTGYRQCSFVR